MKIWVVSAGSGEYSGRWDYPIIAYDNEAAAKAHVERATADELNCNEAITKARTEQLLNGRLGRRGERRHIDDQALRRQMMPLGPNLDGYEIHKVNLMSEFEYPV